MKQIVILWLSLFIGAGVMAQNDTAYYFNANGELAKNNSRYIKKEIVYRNSNTLLIKTSNFTSDGWLEGMNQKWKQINDGTFKITIRRGKYKIRLIRQYIRNNDGTWHFKEQINEKLVREGSAISNIPLLLHDTIKTYYPNGKIKSLEFYQHNELQSNKNWLENGIPYFNNIFYSVDQFPQYTGGNEQLHEHLLAALKRKKVDFTSINGRLEIGFVVFEDGKIGGFRVLNSLSNELEEIVVNAFRSLPESWDPALLDGEKVRYFQTFPINFIHHQYQVEFFDFYSGLVQFESK
jgi:hypothetical protein